MLTETSAQALGELGNVFRVPLRAEVGSESSLPEALVTDRVGLNSLAARGGEVIFAAYDELESDGTIHRVTEDRP